jgi:hypothetical protein
VGLLQSGFAEQFRAQLLHREIRAFGFKSVPPPDVRPFLSKILRSPVSAFMTNSIM